MKIVIRIILTFFAFFASWLFIYWVPFSLLLPTGANIPGLISTIVSIVFATGIGIFVWKKTGSISNSLSTHILMGGIIVGAIGFILGFIGPLIFSKSGTGPLLGIFITGPGGFILGLIGGGIYWRLKVKNKGGNENKNKNKKKH